MRVGLAILMLTALGCGEKPETPWYTDITWIPHPAFDLPRVSANGEDWMGLELETMEVVVEIHPNGRVSAKGRSYSMAELKEHLWRMAEMRRNPSHPSGSNPSEVPLIVRCDRTVPWGRMRAVLETANDWVVRIVDIYFAVKGEGDEPEATRSVWLPVAPGPFERPWTYPWDLPPQHWVAILPTRGSSSKLTGLASALTPGGFPDEERVAMVEVDDRISTEAVLRVIDVLWRAGAPGIVVRRAEGGGMGDNVEILLDGQPLPAGEDAEPRPLPARDERWGLGVR